MFLTLIYIFVLSTLAAAFLAFATACIGFLISRKRPKLRRLFDRIAGYTEGM